MTTTMQLIAKQTVGAGGASTVTFSNIPQTYTDLKVVISTRTTNTLYGETIRIKPNGSTANGSAIILRGYGSGTSSYTYSSVLATNNSLGNGATANTFASIEVYCPNYTSSNYKSFSADSVSENNDTNGRQELTASLWSSTAAITSLVFDNDASYGFTEFSTFYLYGISNSTTTQASTVPYASGGDVITTDGTYWYHAFKYSGSFTPLKNLDADILVVAGGGGSGRTGGGGGAGGLRGFSAQALTSAVPYTCTIGAGGAGSTADGGVASNGVNSSFAGSGFTTINATGGGGGASYSSGNAIGNSGGSGGGGGTHDGNNTTRTGGAGNAGSYSPVEGYAGGTASPNRGSGGGGGATAAGSNGSTDTGGAGGNGSSSYSSWGSATSTGVNISGTYWYAGGGGGSGRITGGAAGNGGASGGTLNSGDRNAAANTGGGAGSNNDMNGYQGGSGIVIVRYAV